MNFHIMLGSLTIVAGMTLISIGTDNGRAFALTMDVIIGSVMVMLGTGRLRKGLWLRKR